MTNNLIEWCEEIVERSQEDYDPYDYVYEGPVDDDSDDLEGWDWED
jgi:hypothetical protein